MTIFLKTISSIFDRPLIRIGSSELSLGAIAQFLLVLFISLVVAFTLRHLLSQQIFARLGFKRGTREAIATLTSYGIGILLCIMLLQSIGINFASFAFIAGSLGIGIGFGLQELTKNFTSGITILLEQKLKVGDFIEWEGLSGYIVDISLRSTVICTITQRHIILPNSYLTTNQVINWTYSDTKGWVSIPVSVTHESDPVLVIEVLMDSAYLEESVSFEHLPEVYFTGFGPNSLDFSLWIWVEQIDKKFITESSLRFIIEQNLRQHGLRLASPRLDLWQRNPAIVVQSSPSSYEEHAALHQPPAAHMDQLTKPIPARDLLRKIPYFQDCTELELKKLVEIGHRRHLQPSEVLYQQGDPGDAFYIVLSGSAFYSIDGSDQVTIVRAGQFIGEFSLMLGVPRTVTVQAQEATTVFAINPPGFRKLLKDQPRLYDLIVDAMGRHRKELEAQGRQLEKLGLLNPSEYDRNPVAWVQKRLEKLFQPSP